MEGEKKQAEARVAKGIEDAERAKTTLVTKSQELQTTTVDLTETKATLEKTQTALKDTQGQLASAKEAVTARESRIKELTTEKDELEKHSTDLKSEISRRDGQITDTQRKLAASEGDREFLLKELKRLQNEKGDLERQFNDLLVLKEQMKKLKEEYALTKRLEWSRRGLADLNNRKGGEVLQRGFAEEDRLQLRVVAVQQELDLGVTQVGDRDAIDDGLRGVVAAHRVNRNDDFAVHASPIL